MSNKRALALWTGGKDSAYALYVSRNDYEVVALITFAPENEAFRAHPIQIMKMQADAMGIQHETITIKEPYFEGYKAAINDLCDRFDAYVVITGDIDLVDGAPNWIRQCCEGTAIEVHTPLWGRDRYALLKESIEHGFKIIMTCAKEEFFDDSWVGREITSDVLNELEGMKTVDVCGENGEYHTMTIDGPIFNTNISIEVDEVRTYESLRHGLFNAV